MNALILMAVLAGPPECPVIRIAAGGEELVIRKLDPQVGVSIQSSQPEDSSSGVIHWGEFFIGFERRVTKAERRRCLAPSRQVRTEVNLIIANCRERVEADGGKWTKETSKAWQEFESLVGDTRDRDKERLSNIFHVNVTKEGDKWNVTSHRDLLAEAFVATRSP